MTCPCSLRGGGRRGRGRGRGRGRTARRGRRTRSVRFLSCMRGGDDVRAYTGSALRTIPPPLAYTGPHRGGRRGGSKYALLPASARTAAGLKGGNWTSPTLVPLNKYAVDPQTAMTSERTTGPVQQRGGQPIAADLVTFGRNLVYSAGADVDTIRGVSQTAPSPVPFVQNNMQYSKV